MTDTTTDQPKPVADRPTGVKLPSEKPKGLIKTDGHKRPRSVVGRVMARERPKALPIPVNRDVQALTKPHVLEKWGQEAAGMRALATDDAVITIFDMIGEDFWSGGGVTAKKVAAQLRAIGDRPIEVQINSPGGDMFEGIAIYNVLREHPQNITVKVMGMAASAASIIAMAGNEVQIGAASFLMIHNCWVLAAGNRNDFREVAEFLEPFDRAMADVYVQRSGQTAEVVSKWMDDETFMSGSLAMERGFADALLPSDQIKVDEKTKAEDRSVNDLRALELTLVHAGKTRADARACITKLKGTPGAAPDTAATPGAGSTPNEDWSGLTGLLASVRS